MSWVSSTLRSFKIHKLKIPLSGFGASPDKHSETIGFATSRAVYLGRTQYTVLMYDSLSKDSNSKPWNITFYDYSSHTMDPEISKKYGKISECLFGPEQQIKMFFSRIHSRDEQHIWEDRHDE